MSNDKAEATYGPYPLEHNAGDAIVRSVGDTIVVIGAAAELFADIDWSWLADIMDRFAIAVCDANPWPRCWRVQMWIMFTSAENWRLIWAAPSRRQVRKMRADADDRLHIRWAETLLKGKVGA